MNKQGLAVIGTAIISFLIPLAGIAFFFYYINRNEQISRTGIVWAIIGMISVGVTALILGIKM